MTCWNPLDIVNNRFCFEILVEYVFPVYVCAFTSACVQLDCLSVRSWDPIITFAVEVQFQIRDQFWIPQPKLHRQKYLIFFVKSQNGLVT